MSDFGRLMDENDALKREIVQLKRDLELMRQLAKAPAPAADNAALATRVAELEAEIADLHRWHDDGGSLPAGSRYVGGPLVINAETANA